MVAFIRNDDMPIRHLNSQDRVSWRQLYQGGIFGTGAPGSGNTSSFQEVIAALCRSGAGGYGKQFSTSNLGSDLVSCILLFSTKYLTRLYAIGKKVQPPIMPLVGEAVGSSPLIQWSAQEETRVRNQGGTSSAIAENFRAVLLAGIPGNVAPRLMRT